MNDMKMSSDEVVRDVILWETGHSKPSDAPENDMPVVVVCTSACADLSTELTGAGLEGDIRYLSASASASGNARSDPPSSSSVPASIAALSDVGLVFVAVDPRVERDVEVANEVSRAARKAKLFVVALVAQTTASTCDARGGDGGLLRTFDSVIKLRADWSEAQSLACSVIGHLAGGLKVAPPVCTDLADVHAILRDAVVSVGVGEAIDSPKLHEGDRARDAAELAIHNVGLSEVAHATGVIVAIRCNNSVLLSEISHVTHQVGNLVNSADALVIPTVHVEASARDGFCVLVLVARSPYPKSTNRISRPPIS